MAATTQASQEATTASHFVHPFIGASPPPPPPLSAMAPAADAVMRAHSSCTMIILRMSAWRADSRIWAGARLPEGCEEGKKERER